MELILINQPYMRDLFKDLYQIFESYFGASSDGLIDDIDEEFETLTQNDHYTRAFCVAAVENGKVIGGAGFEYYEQFNCAWIEHIAVIQSHIGRGVGKALMKFSLERICQECNNCGNDREQLIIFAETDNQNCSFNYNSLRLYSLGFRKLDMKYILCPFYKGGPYLTDSFFLLVYKPELRPGLGINKDKVCMPGEIIKNVAKSWMEATGEDTENKYFKEYMANIDSASSEGCIEVEELFPFTQIYGPSKTGDQVIVIGAGISGLSAAAELTKNGRNVIVLEAQDNFGGRLESTLASTDIHKAATGSEFVCCKSEAIKQLADLFGLNYEEVSSSLGNSFVYINKSFSTYEDFVLNNRAHPLVSNVFGDLGTSTDNNCKLLHLSFDEIFINLLKQCTFVDKRLGWEVKSINWKPNGNDRIEVHSQTPTKGMKCLLATEVIVTVPLQQLKNQDIEFNPNLPEWKTESITKCQCGNSVKLVCRFKERFWKPLHRFIVSPSGFFKHLWFYSIEEKEEKDFNSHHIAVGFATSDITDEISLMPMEKILESFLDQLDTMYSSLELQHPASDAYLNHEYSTWSGMPWIGFDSNSQNQTGDELRSNLARPIDSKLYFSGEATSAGNYGSVEGAIVSGKKSALEILQKKC